MNESDFNDKFMVITAIENNDMTGLTVDKVEADDNGLYISLIHYDEGQQYDENETCISYVISRELKRDNIVPQPFLWCVALEHKQFYK